MSTPIQLLQSALLEYRKAEAELRTYRQKAEKSEREAQSAIENNEVSEVLASNKLALSQVLRERLKSREQELNKTLSELGNTTTVASQQLNSEVRDAWGKRRDVIGRRSCEAMGIPLKALELGELDTILTLSDPLNAIRNFEVAIYAPRYVEMVEQKPLEYITVNVGDREVREPLTIDREPSISQSLDIEHLISSAEQILKNFDELAKESERKI